MMSATVLRVLGRFRNVCGTTIRNGTLRANRPVNPLRFPRNQNTKYALQFRKICRKPLLNEALRAKKPVNSLRFSQNPNSKCTLQLTKTLFSKPSFCRANFVSEPLSVLFRGRLYSSLYRQIRLGAVNRTGRYSSYVAFSFLGITLAENGRSSPSPQITKHPDYHWDLSNSFKKHKKEEAEVTQDFENDTAHGGKPLTAKNLNNGATFATTDQRRSPNGKAVLLKYSEEGLCENKEPKPTESQEEEKLSVHSKDNTGEDASISAERSANFAKWNAKIEEHLTLAICEILAYIIFQFPGSYCEALERSCAGRVFLNVLIQLDIINEYDVTNLQKGLLILRQDKLNHDFVEPYQKSIEDDQYEQHKVKQVMTWEDVNKILKDQQRYAAMGQRNNSQHKQGAPHGENSQREASTLQSNVEEDDRGNLRSPFSVRGQSVLSTSCNDCVSANVLENTKDAQRPPKAGLKVLLKSGRERLKYFQENFKRTVKSATGRFKSRLK